MKSTVQNPRVPVVDGEWWVIAGIPDLGRYNKEGQQPLDFAIWQAADQTWQMVACCRKTGCGGKGRLFHRWQTDSLLSENWTPMGIFMEADPDYGETIGGLQAPNVLQHNGEYFMFYGDWVNIRMARSSDGKGFSRLPITDERGGLCTNHNMISARDPHAMIFGNQIFLYYTGIFPEGGKIMCRVSDNLHSWGDPVIANCGGSGGSGTSDAECPFVVFSEEDRLFYLFRTHTRKDGEGYETTVFCSRDPLDFGVDSDQFKIASLPLEAVRLVRHNGQSYIAALKPDLTGMMMAKMKWAPGVS